MSAVVITTTNDSNDATDVTVTIDFYKQTMNFYKCQTSSVPVSTVLHGVCLDCGKYVCKKCCGCHCVEKNERECDGRYIAALRCIKCKRELCEGCYVCHSCKGDYGFSVCLEYKYPMLYQPISTLQEGK